MSKPGAVAAEASGGSGSVGTPGSGPGDAGSPNGVGSGVDDGAELSGRRGATSAVIGAGGDRYASGTNAIAAATAAAMPGGRNVRRRIANPAAIPAARQATTAPAERHPRTSESPRTDSQAANAHSSSTSRPRDLGSGSGSGVLSGGQRSGADGWGYGR
ncbi:MAG: hypothetical protein NVS3B26_22850 [Mycobacteriales bacterium]